MINDLQDVDTATIPPADGQSLFYDSGVSQWVPRNVVPASTTLGALTDV